ncbi:MAG: pyridoxal 5'-phosphate synthase glutaminase subunit PdxT [Anaerolinea sp. 4484_236]|nr:MAG: pyridoxal 5'-phosphate synthase glutaminase subunit PdxT [Anaerolinea sp. 4484_236]RLD11725.1 MAG: pyridoxal 5'-phosphate synthase glutaminase subunit PdxT [Chloroflexota bacterium]
MKNLTIGVLALQGSFREHITMLRAIGVKTAEVRLPEQLEEIDGLIIPGGESTTIGKLAIDFGLFEKLRAFGHKKAIWGTCAGAIFLSKDAHRQQPLLELMDITVERNAFGRQIASFETDLKIPALAKISSDKAPFHAIFIRAPLIATVTRDAEILSTLPDGRIVAAQQGRLLATAFHPELTSDDRVHRYFLSLVISNRETKNKLTGEQ